MSRPFWTVRGATDPTAQANRRPSHWDLSRRRKPYARPQGPHNSPCLPLGARSARRWPSGARLACDTYPGATHIGILKYNCSTCVRRTGTCPQRSHCPPKRVHVYLGAQVHSRSKQLCSHRVRTQIQHSLVRSGATHKTKHEAKRVQVLTCLSSYANGNGSLA